MNNRHFSDPRKVEAFADHGNLRVAGHVAVLSVLKAIPRLTGIFSPTTRNVLDALVQHTDARTRETFASASRLAKVAGTNKRQVERALSSLRKAGLIATARTVPAGGALPTPKGWETIRATRSTLVHRLAFEDGKSLLQIARTHSPTAVCVDGCGKMPQPSVRTVVSPYGSVLLRSPLLKQNIRSGHASPRATDKGPVLELRSRVSGTRTARESEQSETCGSDVAARLSSRAREATPLRVIHRPPAEMKNGQGGCASPASPSARSEQRRDVRPDARTVLEHWREVCDPIRISEFTAREFLIVGERLRDGWSVAKLCRVSDLEATHKNLHLLTVPDLFGTSARVRTHLENGQRLSSLGVPARFAGGSVIPGRLDRDGPPRAPESGPKICVKRDTKEVWDEGFGRVFAALNSASPDALQPTS